MQSKVKQSKATQRNAMQCNATQSKVKQSKAKQKAKLLETGGKKIYKIQQHPKQLIFFPAIQSKHDPNFAEEKLPTAEPSDGTEY